MNADSAIVNADSEIYAKIVHDKSEAAFTISQNRRSRWIRISVHDQSEYAIRENEQLKKKMAQMEAIVELQKKVSDLLGMHILSPENSEVKAWASLRRLKKNTA